MRAYIRSQSERLCADGLADAVRFGCDTDEVADGVGILRNNASKELNALFEEGVLVKISGRPVRFLDKDVLERTLGLSLPTSFFPSKDAFSGFLAQSGARTQHAGGQDAFRRFIGRDSSLSRAVEQAKAAILYPPDGLNTLILGPTGSGKTTLAETMHKFAVQKGVLPPDAPFVVFNCADYASNPQLLQAQLFGSAKGAFTGADADRPGLVEQADGGILFLDEAHRLPPEGQEMLFLLLDKGIFRRLGETGAYRASHLYLIAATTENPESSLLKTFTRRIPVLIELPPLVERSLSERLQLVFAFFSAESKRVGTPIKVARDVVKSFLLYDCPGNIGQLKSDIQMICAAAFLDHVTYGSPALEVKLSQVSPQLMRGFIAMSQARIDQEQLIARLQPELVFDGTEELAELIPVVGQTDDIYAVIQSSWDSLAGQGVDTLHKREVISQQIDAYYARVYRAERSRKNVSLDEILGKLVNPAIPLLMRKVLPKLESEIRSPERTLFTLALHLNSVLERTISNTALPIPRGYSELFSNVEGAMRRDAAIIADALASFFDVDIKQEEVDFLATLLYAADSFEDSGQAIGVILACHGESTASSMAAVAEKLTGFPCCVAVDIPLEEHPEDSFSRIAKLCCELDSGSGVLILADMGSAGSIGEAVSERTGVYTRTIEMVSTPMLLSVASRILIPHISLDTLCEEVATEMERYRCAGARASTVGYSADYLRTCSPEQYKNLLVGVIERLGTILNAQKVCDTLFDVFVRLSQELGFTIENGTMSRFLLHNLGVIERALRNEGLPYFGLEDFKAGHEELFGLVRACFGEVEDSFNIAISDDELAYVVEIVQTSIIG